MAQLSFILVVVVVIVTTVKSATNIVDLSQHFDKSHIYNRNQAYCTIKSAMAPYLIEGFVIAQYGKLIAEGYSDDHTNLDTFPAFSVTKSFSTMLIGKMVELGQVDVSETLADIFNVTSDWTGVSQASEKQTITLEELLTMTGGLSNGPQQFSDQETLQQVLNYMTYDAGQRGKFNYLGANQILSRIILRRSGQTPREFVREYNLFDQLGISEFNYNWDTFGDVEGSAYGLHATPRSLAKLGQLYLQNGLAARGNQMIPSEWIQTSITDQLSEDTASVQCLVRGYGYQWYVDREDRTDGLFVPLPQLEGAYSANGVQGQHIVVIPDKEIVIAIMSTDYTQIYNYSFLVTILLNLAGLDEEVEDLDGCGDFSLMNFLGYGGISFLLGGWKVLNNLIFEP